MLNGLLSILCFSLVLIVGFPYQTQAGNFGSGDGTLTLGSDGGSGRGRGTITIIQDDGFGGGSGSGPGGRDHVDILTDGGRGNVYISDGGDGGGRGRGGGSSVDADSCLNDANYRQVHNRDCRFALDILGGGSGSGTYVVRRGGRGSWLETCSEMSEMAQVMCIEMMSSYRRNGDCFDCAYNELARDYGPSEAAEFMSAISPVFVAGLQTLGTYFQADAYRDSSRAYARSQERMAAGNNEACLLALDSRIAYYQSVELPPGAGSLDDHTCNGASAGAFSGFRGTLGNGIGGPGNPWMAAGYNPGFLRTFAGPAFQMGFNGGYNAVPGPYGSPFFGNPAFGSPFGPQFGLNINAQAGLGSPYAFPYASHGLMPPQYTGGGSYWRPGGYNAFSPYGGGQFNQSQYLYNNAANYSYGRDIFMRNQMQRMGGQYGSPFATPYAHPGGFNPYYGGAPYSAGNLGLTFGAAGGIAF